MRRWHIILITVFALIVIIVIFAAKGWLIYGMGNMILDGPGPILKLLQYECEDRRTVFPQWVNNDEICYLELVLHYDDHLNEKLPFFIKGPVMDIYIYREKVNQPETKKLIKHIIMGNIDRGLSQAAPSNKDFGFKICDNGRKMFLYYHYYGVLFTDYRYMTMNIKGGNIKKRIIEIIPPDMSEYGKIIPFDISQDGKKLYGIIKVNTLPDVYAIAEYAIKTKKVRKLLDITDEKFRETRNARIKNLKLLADDKMVLTYTSDANKSPCLEYTYLIDIPSNKCTFIEELWDVFNKRRESSDIFGDTTAILSPDRTYAMTNDKRYLISGNNCIYEREGDNWVKIKDFFKTNPIISPDGKKILYYNILTEEGHRGSVSYTGEKLAVSDIKTIFEEEK